MIENVFILDHTYGSSDDEKKEALKRLGVYSSPEEAKKAIKIFVKQPGFKDYPDGFVIDKYRLNTDNKEWKSGF